MCAEFGMGLWAFCFLLELHFFEFGNGWRENAPSWFAIWWEANGVFHVPSVCEGTLHRLVYSVISHYKTSSGKTDLVHKACGASWSCRWCLEALELEEQPGWCCKLGWYSEHFCICKLLAANCYCQAWSSPSVYIRVNKLEQENKWPGTPGLAYSQKKIHLHSLDFSWLWRSRNEFHILDNKQDTGLKQG